MSTAVPNSSRRRWLNTCGEAGRTHVRPSVSQCDMRQSPCCLCLTFGSPPCAAGQGSRNATRTLARCWSPLAGGLDWCMVGRAHVHVRKWPVGGAPTKVNAWRSGTDLHADRGVVERELVDSQLQRVKVLRVEGVDAVRPCIRIRSFVSRGIPIKCPSSSSFPTHARMHACN